MKSSHLTEFFNNILISSTSEHKHLGMLLDDRLSYEYHFKFVLNKAKKTIGPLRKFSKVSRDSLQLQSTNSSSASLRLWRYCL